MEQNLLLQPVVLMQAAVRAGLSDSAGGFPPSSDCKIDAESALLMIFNLKCLFPEHEMFHGRSVGLFVGLVGSFCWRWR